MEWELVILMSVMFGTAVYLLLDRALLHVVMGVMVLSNAVNVLLMLTSGDPDTKAAPILEGGASAPMVDPLPQALILTAIVISFGLLSFFAAVVYIIFEKTETDDLFKLFRRRK